MAKPFQNILNWVAKTFRNNPSGMVITSGVIGWGLSSAAQIVSILKNPKIKDEQKGFLVPQEIYDAVTNITSYFLITLCTQRFARKIFTTGKFAPKSVRQFLHKKPELEKKVGKLDLNLDDVLLNDKNASDKVKKDYNIVKNIGVLCATVLGGVISSNIITPLIRNKKAASIQKGYIATKENPDDYPELKKLQELHQLHRPVMPFSQNNLKSRNTLTI